MFKKMHYRRVEWHWDNLMYKHLGPMSPWSVDKVKMKKY